MIVSSKMAEEVSEEIEDALQLIVNTAEQSGNMKKGLKQTIIETVGTLRNLIVNLHYCRDSKTAEISKLEKQFNDLKAELEQNGTAKKLGTSPIIGNYVPAGTTGMIMAPSGDSDGKHNPAGTTAGRQAPPGGGTRLLLGSPRRWDDHKTLPTDKEKQREPPPDKITELLKIKINPIEMQVGINKFKPLNNGKVLIETNTKQEIEALEKDIN